MLPIRDDGADAPSTPRIHEGAVAASRPRRGRRRPYWTPPRHRRVRPLCGQMLLPFALADGPVCRRSGCGRTAAYERQGRRGLCGTCYREFKAGTLILPPEEETPDPLGGMCQHCRKKPGVSGRGLCRGCYENPEVRGQYAKKKTSPVGRDSFRRSPIPDAPTEAMPGTDEKSRVIEERRRKGQALFHPEDAGMLKPERGGCFEDEEEKADSDFYSRLIDNFLPDPRRFRTN